MMCYESIVDERKLAKPNFELINKRVGEYIYYMTHTGKYTAKHHAILL